MVTIHGNGRKGEVFDINTVFLSEDHAARHGSNIYVFNGLDFDQYGSVDWELPRSRVLFLAKAKRKEKNLKDSLRICREAGERLSVIGGYGVDLTGRVVYKGFLGGVRKNRELNAAKCLLTPVLWNEPFGLSVAESLFFGTPVIATPFGSLPQLVIPEVGFLSDRVSELVEAVRDCGRFDRKRCREYCLELFSGRAMTEKYLGLFGRVMNGERLNPFEPRTLDAPLERDFRLRE
jgi:glycosyltransferase involved in cell wall biosynthesis